MWARVCWEAGGRVRTNVYLRDMNLLGIAANDGRRTEAAANGLALKQARRRKQTTYPELVGSRRGYLLVAGAETGDRWDEAAYKLLVTLARARARSAP
ncbi:unnamed protein product, partial [Prorocentrum cordatum]